MNSQPISLIRGHDSVVPVRIELGYAPLDLSTATAATFTAKPGELSTVVKITKTLGSGVTAGLLGLANISFSVADMAELDVSNSYTWSLTATVGGVASIVARGVLTAIGEPQQFVDEGVDQVARDLAASKASPAQVAAAAAAAVAGITLPSVLHAQVGDVFQLFYFDVARGSAAISCRCDIGTAYSRYFEVTPSAGQVGDHTITVNAHAPDGSLLKSASTTLRVSAAPANPGSVKNVAIIGDSLAAGGGWTTEFIRRIRGSGGTPAALAATNFHFVGESLAGGISGYGITGYGGWTWGNYSGSIGSGVVIRADSHDKTEADLGSNWTSGGNTYGLVSVKSPTPFSNLVPNGGFESWASALPDDWLFQNPGGEGVFSKETSFVAEGAVAAKLIRQTGVVADQWYRGAALSVLTVEPARTYSVRSLVSGSGLYAVLAVNGVSVFLIEPTSIGSGAGVYTSLDFSFTVPAGTTQLYLYFAPGLASGSTLFVDCISMRDTTPTSLKFIRTAGSGDLPTSGTLVHSSGATHTASITFTASSAEPATPFWNAQKSDVDMATWGSRMASGGPIEYFVIELGWNEWSIFYSGGTNTELTALVAYIATAYPAAKVLLVGMANPSPTGGLGANYGADIDLSSYEFSRKFARDYDALIRSKAVGWIEYVPIYPVVDSVHAYPESAVPVNSRSAETEMRGTNGVHPENGYSQIADAVYRQFSSDI